MHRRAFKKARIFCIFSLLNIQYTYSWHINIWLQDLFLKPWTVWHSLAYLPALRLRWKLYKQFATDVPGISWIFLPNTELVVDSQDAAPCSLPPDKWHYAGKHPCEVKKNGWMASCQNASHPDLVRASSLLYCQRQENSQKLWLDLQNSLH